MIAIRQTPLTHDVEAWFARWNATMPPPYYNTDGHRTASIDASGVVPSVTAAHAWRIAMAIRQQHPAAVIGDLGAGVGHLAALPGCWGFEGAAELIPKMIAPQRVAIVDVTRDILDLDRQFSVLCGFELLEHVPRDSLATLFANLRRMTTHFLGSIHMQGVENTQHQTVAPLSWWRTQTAPYGFHWDDDEEAWRQACGLVGSSYAGFAYSAIVHWWWE